MNADFLAENCLPRRSSGVAGRTENCFYATEEDEDTEFFDGINTIELEIEL